MVNTNKDDVSPEGVTLPQGCYLAGLIIWGLGLPLLVLGIGFSGEALFSIADIKQEALSGDLEALIVRAGYYFYIFYPLFGFVVFRKSRRP